MSSLIMEGKVGMEEGGAGLVRQVTYRETGQSGCAAASSVIVGRSSWQRGYRSGHSRWSHLELLCGVKPERCVTHVRRTGRSGTRVDLY